MAELKTKLTGESVEAFLNTVSDENKRRDAFTVLELMRKVTGAEPRMWGTSIIGFGDTHLKYASGRELDWFLVGFSPRKKDLTLYLGLGPGWGGDLLDKLGKHKTGMGCLYLHSLNGVDMAVLEALIERSVAGMKSRKQGPPAG
jgi:hypothetical protein